MKSLDFRGRKIIPVKTKKRIKRNQQKEPYEIIVDKRVFNS